MISNDVIAAEVIVPDNTSRDGMSQEGASAVTPISPKPERCVIVVDNALPPGRAANAAAVIALTIGQRHPALVGEPLIDGSGNTHPGLIPIGIPVLGASQVELGSLRTKGMDAACDIVAFPLQGQQTTNYDAFRAAVSAVPTEHLQYVGVALIGGKKSISKIVANLGLLK